MWQPLFSAGWDQSMGERETFHVPLDRFAAIMVGPRGDG
jgi:hypothetical protein